MTNACASLAKLAELKLDCDAELIRAIWKAKNRADLEAIYPPAADIDRGFFRPYRLRELKREVLNKAGGFFGVEYLGTLKRSGEPVYYANAGDCYAGTLIFTGPRLTVGTVGDLIERGTVREGEQL